MTRHKGPSALGNEKIRGYEFYFRGYEFWCWLFVLMAFILMCQWHLS
jgi:hypothetical protein